MNPRPARPPSRPSRFVPIFLAVASLLAVATAAAPEAKRPPRAGHPAARGSASRGAAAGPPSRRSTDPAAFAAVDSVVEVDEDFNWRVPLRFTNPGETGLYPDSLTCDVEDLDPGETRGPRTAHLDLRVITRLVGPIAAGG